MSSSTRLRPERAAAWFAALITLGCLVQWLGVGTASAAEVSVAAVTRSSADGRVSLAVDVQGPDVGVLSSEAFSVTAGGVRQATSALPVLRERVPIAIILDASAAGASALGAGASGAADFLLQVPPTSRVAVVADRKPPVLAARPQTSANAALSALSTVTAHGDRSTSEAVTMAVNAIPSGWDDPGLIMLYTNAANAGGEAAQHLADRLTRTHTVLTVISTARDTTYWSTVVGATGGVMVIAQPQGIMNGFDQAQQIMRGRYLVSFPPPEHLPAIAQVEVRTPGGTLAAQTVIPRAAPSGPDSATANSSARRHVRLLAIAAGVLIGSGAAVVLILLRWRRERRQERGRGRGRHAGGGSPPVIEEAPF